MKEAKFIFLLMFLINVSINVKLMLQEKSLTAKH